MLCITASVEARGESALTNDEKLTEIGGRERRGKNWEMEGKSGRKGKNHEGSFTLSVLTGRAGYATEYCHCTSLF